MAIVEGRQRARRAACVVLATLMWAIFIFWTICWVLRPTTVWDTFFHSFAQRTTTTYFGRAGSFALIFTVPILLIALIGAVYLEITAKLNYSISKRRKCVRFDPWTYPLLVGGPLGIVSAAELIILGCLVGLIVWTLVTYLTRDFSTLDPKKLPHGWTLWQKKLDKCGSRLGLLGLVPFNLLFIPVSRGSVILQLLNIPFERAVKYHIWIANITLFIWTVHGIVFTILWGSRHQLHLLWKWKRTEVTNVCGVVALIIGLIMGLTSIYPIRKHKFELFYYTHHLYVVFIVGFMLHAGNVVLSTILGGLFLFFVDRFLRYVQYQHITTTTRAHLLCSNMVEVEFPKPPWINYNTLSTIFVKFPNLSTLQWHPFTLTSSSIAKHISILVKCQGQWTNQLTEAIKATLSRKKLPTQLLVAIEGPYGQKFDFFYRYETIIFVAGGSGISPFLGLLQELTYLHRRHPSQYSSLLTSQLVLIWAMKSSQELRLLTIPTSFLNSNSTCKKPFRLEIKAFVTREAPDMETDHSDEARRVMRWKTRDADDTHRQLASGKAEITSFCTCSFPRIRRTTGCQHAYIGASIVGYCLVEALSGHFIVNRLDPPPRGSADKIHDSMWTKCLFAILAMIVGIVVFGGTSVRLIELLLQKKREPTERAELACACERNQADAYETVNNILHASKICYGSRPDFDKLFSEIERQNGRVAREFGVLVCGPQSMLQSVAFQCRAHTSFTSATSNNIFHFHPLTFDL